MSDAPERIGLIGDGFGNWALAEKSDADVAIHYVRADLLEAERARVKELEAALREASKEINTTEMALQHLAGRFVKASVYDVERARADRLEAERDALRECLRPFAATFERYPGFSDYALFGVWEDVNGAAGRKLNILRKQDFDNARDALGDGK